jgi:hypothetical protein
MILTTSAHIWQDHQHMLWKLEKISSERGAFGLTLPDLLQLPPDATTYLSKGNGFQYQ